jgi:hypothetical protein
VRVAGSALTHCRIEIAAASLQWRRARNPSCSFHNLAGIALAEPSAMLDQFQVCDLPLLDVVLALETTPLRDVGVALESSDCRCVLVLDAGAGFRGLAMRDTVLRHAGRLSDMRVGMLPLLGVVELAPSALLIDAARAVSTAGVGALVCRLGELSDPQVMLRDEMLNLTDWSPLQERRAQRQAFDARPNATSAQAMPATPPGARKTPPTIYL